MKVLAQSDLLKGKTIGIDAATLETNAALRSIVRRDMGQKYEAFLQKLARASGIESPTREDLAKLDRKRLLRKRGELLERPFAHCYGTGGMRRTHLRGHARVLKRLLVHVAGCNLGLLMRKLFGVETPRGLQGLLFELLDTMIARARELW